MGVQNLLIPGIHSWDTNLIHALFSIEDVNDILAIPLGRAITSDKLIRYLSKNVLACSLTIDNTHLVEGNWKTL